MARRFVYFQGSAKMPDYPLKMLLERYDGVADGYYVGGWSQEPVFVAPFENAEFIDIVLRGITATGPGPDDWLVGGFRRFRANTDNFEIVFIGPNGVVRQFPLAFPFNQPSGHFSTGLLFNPLRQNFCTATGANGVAPAIPGFGYVLPNVRVGTRLNTDPSNDLALREFAVPNPDLSYAVFVGNIAGPGFTNGNPWLASAGGTFTRLNTNLNAAIPRSDLIGLTLYERNQDFLRKAPWPNAGEHSLTVTPHAITTGGIVTTGTPFPVAYQAPDPAAWFTWDASLWVEPTATP